MGCQGNKFIVPSPSVDFTSNNQILKYKCPYYKNIWVYKNPTRGGWFHFLAHGLFDEGAQRSFITEHLAADLALPMQNREFVKLAAFGENMDRGRCFEKGRAYLKTDTGNIAIDVLVIPTIAAPLQNIPQQIQQLPYLRDLKLAHSISFPVFMTC